MVENSWKSSLQNKEEEIFGKALDQLSHPFKHIEVEFSDHSEASSVMSFIIWISIYYINEQDDEHYEEKYSNNSENVDYCCINE